MFYYTVFFVYCVSVVSLSLWVLLHWLAQNKSCISSTGGMLDFSMNVLPGQASISNETHEGLMDWLDCWVQVTGGFIDYILMCLLLLFGAQLWDIFMGCWSLEDPRLLAGAYDTNSCGWAVRSTLSASQIQAEIWSGLNISCGTEFNVILYDIRTY